MKKYSWFIGYVAKALLATVVLGYVMADVLDTYDAERTAAEHAYFSQYDKK